VTLGLGIVARFGFGGWDISDRLQEASIVEPIDPFEGCELDGLEASPRSTPMDDLGLVEAIDRLGERVVVGIADAADRRDEARFDQAFRVFDSKILRPPDALLFVKQQFVWR
jgi:hypothetical protein